MPDLPTPVAPYRTITYRPYHSTETAVVRVTSDMVCAVDQGHTGALALLNLSAAFDTVDHEILVDVLRRRLGVEGWLASGVPSRSQPSRPCRRDGVG